MAKQALNESRPKGADVSDDEIDRQMGVAISVHARKRKVGLVARSAKYDSATQRVLIEMSDGFLFGIPARSIREIAGATEAQRGNLAVDELGAGVRWDDLDADVSVSGMLMKHAAYSTILSANGRRAGSVKSKAKAKAARANGAKGGRPRKART